MKGVKKIYITGTYVLCVASYKIFPILAYLHRADEDGESENVLPATESTKHIRQ